MTDYFPPHWACGTPIDFFIKQEKKTGRFTKKGEPILITHKYCGDCFDLKDRVSKCLTCRKEFTPGCNIKHVCYLCLKIRK